jgi:hypothetical protein
VVDASTSSESVAALEFIKYASFTPYKLTIAGIIRERRRE